jgi:hypothetical protein
LLVHGALLGFAGFRAIARPTLLVSDDYRGSAAESRAGLVSTPVALQRGIDGSDPVRPEADARPARTLHDHRATRQLRVATGTLACPRCDAPVALGGERLAPTAVLGCPFCDHAAPLRAFLSLGEPTRPTRVEVLVVDAPRPRRRVRSARARP